MRDYSTVERLVLDTSVIIEYIISRSMYRPRVAKLFRAASAGEIELYVSPITLSETLYIASKVYQAARVQDPNSEALDFVEWVKKRVKVVEINENIIFRAGELKKLLYIALPDCYVIATAKDIEAIPLFKTVEKEMEPVLKELRRLGLKFLDEIEV